MVIWKFSMAIGFPIEFLGPLDLSFKLTAQSFTLLKKKWKA